MIEAAVPLRRPLDLVTTLGPLRHGAGDRTVLIGPSEAWLAWREPSGPTAIRLRVTTERTVHATAWGPGTDAALARLPALIGELDDPDALVAHHPIIRQLQRRHPGLRLPRSGRLFDALVPSILEQKVTGTEAFRAYAALQRRYADGAPGPMRELRLPVTPQVLAGLPYHAFHPLGVERRRAEVIRRVATRAAWLDASADAAQAARRLRSFAGIGPWTTAEVVRSAFGDPDAVSVGDFHLPHSVTWALAGEPRGSDARMLELLEPYCGQRGRVQRLLEVGRITAPRRGPRLAPRSLAAI